MPIAMLSKHVFVLEKVDENKTKSVEFLYAKGNYLYNLEGKNTHGFIEYSEASGLCSHISGNFAMEAIYYFASHDRKIANFFIDKTVVFPSQLKKIAENYNKQLQPKQPEQSM